MRFGSPVSMVLVMTSLIDHEELERQIDVHKTELQALAAQLADVQNRLRSLLNIQEAVRALEGPTFANPEDAAMMHAPLTEKDVSNFIEAARPVLPPKPATKRIRSTEMVADMINSSDRSWTREGIHDGFKQLYGYPDSWGNPANALNNAIGRAAANGLIVELNDRYMSRTVAAQEQASEEVGEADA